MFLEIELLYFVLMIGTFIGLLLWAKLPSGLCLMSAALVGGIASFFGSGTPFELRYFVEGTFGYFDTILIITTAMIFMGGLTASGGLEYISARIVKTFRKYPTVLLIIIMLIIMFPAMVTGSSLSSSITAGALFAPIMIKWGIPKNKTAAIIALGAILGMIAPPINVPAMVICDVVDIAFTNFQLPLLVSSIPTAIICVLLIGRKYVKPIAEEDVSKIVDTSVLEELNWKVCIPVFILILLIIGEMIYPPIFGNLAMAAMFVLATIPTFFFGRKVPFFTTEEDTTEVGNSVVQVVSKGVYRAFPAMGLLMGVGMFMEIIALNGVRAYFVANAITLPNFLRYVSMALFLPIIGGISSFGSASMLGGPFVMALMNGYDSVILVCGLSMLAAIGEFLPPTAMSATFAGQMVGENKWARVSKAAIPAIGVMFVYSLLYIFIFGKIIYNIKAAEDKIGVYLIVLLVTTAVAVAFAIGWSILVKKVSFFNKHAHDVALLGAAGEEVVAEDKGE